MEIQYSESKIFSREELFALFDSVGWLSAKYSERLVRALSGSSTVFSAWDGEKLVGLINALDDGELTAYIHYLLVAPEYHGLGIGKHLALSMRNKYCDYLYVVLIAENAESIGFYEKLGFKLTIGATPLDITHY